jgi:hypothetical protein
MQVAALSSTETAPPADWTAIRQANCPLVIEPRGLGALAAGASALAQDGPFERRGEGKVGQALAALGPLPAALLRDIAGLAGRFAALVGTHAVRLRLEAIASNACRKIHADYTDIRLITTYAGPGTDYVPLGAAAEESSLQAIPTGWIALFKGRTFHPDHPFCLHRSPPAADLGARRLVLVIDTPLDLARAGIARPEAPECRNRP